VRLAVVRTAGPDAGVVTTYDGAAGASVAVPNASAGALQAALVVVNAGTTAAASQALTVTGSGIGAPAEIAPLYVWLAAAESSYASGQVVGESGGRGQP